MLVAPAITVENAYLRYRAHLLFADISLHLPAGQTTCLLGPSGAGKTSLLRMLAALPFDKHAVKAAAISASDQRPISNRMSYLAQTDLLLPWLNCIDNTLIGYRLRNAQTIALYEKAKNLLIKVGLEQALHKYPKQLSGGMRQRAALVRTLLEDQPILLMDEPFSALDAITRLQLQGLTAQYIINKTVLLITHDPLEALRLGHQIIVMAGQPAHFSEPLLLKTPPPRALTDGQLLALQGQLMQQLATANQATI